MSFGSYQKDESIYTAITAANDNNIICVAAAGNDNISANCYPACYENTLSIAACTENLEKASFSNYNNSVTKEIKDGIIIFRLPVYEKFKNRYPIIK